MSVPLKIRLGYAWARATHADRIYSHVFEKENNIEKTKNIGAHLIESENGPSDYHNVKYTIHAKDTNWLMAMPIDGGDKTYRIYECSTVHFSCDVEFPMSDYMENPIHGVFTHDQVIDYITKAEEKYLKDGKLPSQRQPFKSFIKTNLLAPKI